MKNILRIVLLLQAPIGLGLLVVSVANPESQNAAGLTYGGIILMIAGLIGSFMPRRSAYQEVTWWWVAHIGFDLPPGKTEVRRRAWITTIVVGVLLLFAGLFDVQFPGLPIKVTWWGTYLSVFVLAGGGALLGLWFSQRGEK